VSGYWYANQSDISTNRFRLSLVKTSSSFPPIPHLAPVGMVGMKLGTNPLSWTSLLP
jgi:hypothetical protein